MSREGNALIAAWRRYRVAVRERDGIRPPQRVDGRSFEAGWKACLAWLDENAMLSASGTPEQIAVMHPLLDEAREAERG